MIIQKPVKDYAAYVWRQGEKAREMKEKLLAANPDRQRRFAGIFNAIKKHMIAGRPVLCLGARTGCEVIAAESVGFAGSVGIDLFPLSKSVIEADWHNMPFTDGAFQNVFTNSIDHCADLGRLISEIKRVMASGGCFILVATYGPKIATPIEQRAAKNSKEFLFWENPLEIANEFVKHGFYIKHEAESGDNKIYILKTK